MGIGEFPYPRRVVAEGELGADADATGEADENRDAHDHRDHDVHDSYLLVVNRSKPFLPEPLPSLQNGDQNYKGDHGKYHAAERPHDNWIGVWYRR